MTRKTHFTFVEHLGELRKRVLIALGAMLAGTCLGYFVSDGALRLFLKPIRDQIGQAYFFSPAEAFVVKMKVAIFLGTLIASPVILGQLWLFVSPALTLKERKSFLPLVGVTSVFFLAGVLFCFYLVMPSALGFLMGMQSDYLKPMISVTEYISFLFGMSLAFGAAFNMPVVILSLTQAGILKSATLNRYQRHAVVLIFIAAAVLTPGPDIASQLLLAIPLLALFEISVGLAIGLERRKNG